MLCDPNHWQCRKERSQGGEGFDFDLVNSNAVWTDRNVSPQSSGLCLETLIILQDNMASKPGTPQLATNLVALYISGFKFKALKVTVNVS
jgi:hypothetical protein